MLNKRFESIIKKWRVSAGTVSLKRFPFCSPTILYHNYEVIVKFLSLSNL